MIVEALSLVVIACCAYLVHRKLRKEEPIHVERSREGPSSVIRIRAMRAISYVRLDTGQSDLPLFERKDVPKGHLVEFRFPFSVAMAELIIRFDEGKELRARVPHPASHPG